MKRLKLWTAIALTVMLTVTMSGCQNRQDSQSSQNSQNSKDNSGGKADNGGNDMLYGQVSSVSDSEISVKIAERHKGQEEQEAAGEEQTFKVTEETKVYKEDGMGGGPKGEMPENQQKPDGEEGEAPERPEKPGGEEASEQPKNIQGEKSEAPERPEGDQDRRDDMPERQTQEAQISDIQSGDMVRISVDGDNAATIIIQNMPADKPETNESDAKSTTEEL